MTVIFRTNAVEEYYNMYVCNVERVLIQCILNAVFSRDDFNNGLFTFETCELTGRQSVFIFSEQFSTKTFNSHAQFTHTRMVYVYKICTRMHVCVCV